MIFIIVPGQISGTSDYGIAPDVFPLTILWLITGLSVMLFASRLVKRARLDRTAIMSARTWGFVAAASVFLCASFLGIQFLGFRIGGALVLATPMIVMGELRHFRRMALICVLTPLGIFYLFWNIFHIPLP